MFPSSHPCWSIPQHSTAQHTTLCHVECEVRGEKGKKRETKERETGVCLGSSSVNLDICDNGRNTANAFSVGCARSRYSQVYPPAIVSGGQSCGHPGPGGRHLLRWYQEASGGSSPEEAPPQGSTALAIPGCFFLSSPASCDGPGGSPCTAPAPHLPSACSLPSPTPLFGFCFTPTPHPFLT